MECLKEVLNNFNMSKFSELENSNVYVLFKYSANLDGFFNKLTNVKFRVDKSMITDMEHSYIKELTAAFRAVSQWNVMINGERLIGLLVA